MQQSVISAVRANNQIGRRVVISVAVHVVYFFRVAYFSSENSFHNNMMLKLAGSERTLVSVFVCETVAWR